MPQYNIEKSVEKINTHCMRGSGIYATGAIGGRYFEARINEAGVPELFNGYDWVEFDFNTVKFNDGNWVRDIPMILA